MGAITGIYLGDKALCLKPIGDIFLNLLLSAIVPLIFFSVSSAISSTSSVKKLGKILYISGLVFLSMSAIAACYALLVVKLFPPAAGIDLVVAGSSESTHIDMSTHWVNLFTVSDFSQLFSHQHILALIIFSMLVGLAAATTRETNNSFTLFLQAGERVFMKVFSLIMYLAPIGFFAWFAVMVAEMGPKLADSYFRIGLTYYAAATLYFLIAYTGFAWVAGKQKGVRLFWKNLFLPMITALATCSSAASIPANLKAAKNMLVPREIYETVIPLGTMLHKEGSVIGGAFKIAFIFGLFHLDFSGMAVMTTAFFVSVLVGTVMGAIPGGGMLGEMLILGAYGFPSSALIAIAAISIIIDPLATMLNVCGNTVSAMLVNRFSLNTITENGVSV